MKHLNDGERTEGNVAHRIGSELDCGMALVDANGEVVWVDEDTRRDLNGGLTHLGLPLRRENSRPFLDCFLTVVDIDVKGTQKRLCVIQQTHPERSATGRDVRNIASAIEAVMADPSWITQALIEKVNAWLQAAEPQLRLPDLHRLTGREREILVLVCEGRTDVEIGGLLNLSQNTVRNHLASVFRKIGVNRRSSAVVWARERGITRHDVLQFKRITHAVPPMK